MIAQFLGAHLVVLATWLLAFTALAGLGSLLFTWLGGAIRSWRDVSTSVWLGVAATIGVLQLWHFLAPVTGWTTVGLIALGGAGLWRARMEIWSLLRRANAPRWTVVAAAALLVVWVVNRAIGPTRLYDTGMYHQPFVNWINAYALVPGLGNLHGRLAHNSSAHLFDALFDVGALDKLAMHVANGLLIAILALEGLLSWTSMRRNGTPRAWHLFSIAILPAAILAAMRHDVRSLSSDAAVFAVEFAALRLLFDALAHRASERRIRGTQGAVVLTLLAMAVTIKLSAAFLAAFGGLAVLWLWRRQGAGDDAISWARLTRWMLPAVMLVVAMMGRSVVLSGYPLYPASILPFPVDWRVPAEQAAGEVAWIEAGARNLNTNIIYTGASWMRPWVRTVLVVGDLFVEFTVPILLIGLAAVIWWIRGRVFTRPQWSDGWPLIWIPLTGSAVLWAATAPHPRMVQGIAWSAVAVAASILAASHKRSKGAPAAILGVCAAGLIVALVARRTIDIARDADHVLPALVSSVVTPIGEAVLQPLPDRRFTSFTTSSGLVVPVPDGDNRCYNGPLLCTPHPTPHLALRDPANMGRGFRTIGSAWAPKRWPNPYTRFLEFWRCSRDAGDAGDAQREREQYCYRQITAAPAPGLEARP